MIRAMFQVKKGCIGWLSFIMLLGVFGLADSALAAGLLELGVEPIVGYEYVQAILPSRHSVSRLVYGARVTAGVLMFSGEAEMTRGVTSEDYGTYTQSITGDRVKVGVRSNFGLGSLLRVFLRVGGQAAQDRFDVTSGGVTATYYSDLKISPYAGAGLNARLSSLLSAHAGVTAVVPDFQDMTQNEYQATAGFRVKF